MITIKTTVKGIKIGNLQDEEALTGVTVILCENGATAGVDVRGSAPGTRETDLLDPVNTVDKVHAVVLSGGSAFGLAAATGVMKYLEEREIGFDVGVTKVPIVCQAVLFDLLLGDYKVRPDEVMGYKACENAGEDFEIGNYGAGTGASIGKINSMEFAMKSGLGYSEFVHESGLVVGALVAVNAFGDIIKDGKIIAGALNKDKASFANTSKLMTSSLLQRGFDNTNTTIGAIITNAKLSKAQCKKVSQVAHNGYARAISPIHTTLDGDTIFALATGEIETSIDVVANLASEVMQEAIYSAVKSSKSVLGLKSFNDLSDEK
ncbi:conserved protein of unknown function [Acetoanaerobium sticklandii]|uniref:Uncharacterized protein n=1 Tax=Acetoanaerobium sticklandii (strain ATCC 12662 / DSM 519 / JCM 1433 / CCUG 9281 / NCIMB 10654 / HF) TaxID=499177 RepID=E3PXA7_ACESD|nr:P1 family peptidase [Acetoanaerobium sticklandii]CBH21072.1 conserved protein of unknown function [Acetoanaerobium sticklandii]